MTPTDRRERLFLAVWTALLLLGAGGRAATRPLWHDEIFTLYVATAPSFTGVWTALAHGVDLNPPLYHFAVRASAAVLGPTALAVRLPALLGFVVATLAVYAMARRRLGMAFAFLAASVLCLGSAYTYAYEGRPYGLVLACAALAMLAWQRRVESRTSAAMPLACALALVAAVTTHYYALLLLPPLMVGEWARARRLGRVDWPMWVAFSAVVPAVAVLTPLIQAAAVFGERFWTRPSPFVVIRFYRDLLEPFAVAPVVAAAAITLTRILRPVGDEDHRHAPWPLPREESVAWIALLIVPVLAYVVSDRVTEVFHQRYVLYAALGFALLTAVWTCAGGLRGRHLRIAVLVCLIGVAARQVGGLVALARGASDPIAEDRRVLSVVPPGAELVVSHALRFLPLVFYWPSPPVHAVYLARPPEVVRALGVDTGSRALRQLAEIAPIDVSELDRFVADHPVFFVYGPPSWLIPHLIGRGAAVLVVAGTGDRVVYRVQMPIG